jgi:large subunit ribosomal protein L31e
MKTFTIPLRKGFSKAPRYKKTNRAVSELRSFLKRHMKNDNISIGKELNELLWQHGIKNPPPRVKVHAVEDEGKVLVNLESVKIETTKEKEAKTKKKAPKAKLEDAVKKAITEKEPVEKKVEKPTETKPAEKKAETKVPQQKTPIPKEEVTEKKTEPKEVKKEVNQPNENKN